MHAVRQEHDVAFRLRVEPQRGAGETGVTERRSRRKQIAAVRRVGRIDVPPETAHVFHACGRRRRDHPFDRRRRQNSRALEAAAVEQHAAEARQVRRRAEQPRVAGDAAHTASRWIVHDAAQERNRRVACPERSRGVAGPRQWAAPLGRRDARLQRRRRQEHRVVHRQRIEDVRLRVAIEALAADAAHDVAEQEEIDVAVDEPLARLRRGRQIARAANRLVGAAEFDFERQIGRQSRRMRQQMEYGDRLLAVRAELGDELRDGIAQTNAPLLHELHHARRRRHDFGQRGEIEDRVVGDRLGRRRDRATTERALVENAVAASDEHDGTRQFVARNRGVDERRDRRERLRLRRVLSARSVRPCRAEGVERRRRHERENGDRRAAASHGIQYILAS